MSVLKKAVMGMNMQLKGKEEEVGSLRVDWEDLVQSGEISRPIDRWYPCKAGQGEGACVYTRSLCTGLGQGFRDMLTICCVLVCRRAGGQPDGATNHNANRRLRATHF